MSQTILHAIAPPGFVPMPKSKHNGWHKVVGGKVVDEWYPPKSHIGVPNPVAAHVAHKDYGAMTLAQLLAKVPDTEFKDLDPLEHDSWVATLGEYQADHAKGSTLAKYSFMEWLTAPGGPGYDPDQVDAALATSKWLEAISLKEHAGEKYNGVAATAGSAPGSKYDAKDLKELLEQGPPEHDSPLGDHYDDWLAAAPAEGFAEWMAKNNPKFTDKLNVSTSEQGEWFAAVKAKEAAAPKTDYHAAAAVLLNSGPDVSNPAFAGLHKHLDKWKAAGSHGAFTDYLKAKVSTAAYDQALLDNNWLAALDHVEKKAHSGTSVPHPLGHTAPVPNPTPIPVTQVVTQPGSDTISSPDVSAAPASVSPPKQAGAVQATNAGGNSVTDMPANTAKLEAPTGFGWYHMTGQPVTTPDGAGTVVGWDQHGKIVVNVGGTEKSFPFNVVAQDGAKIERKTAISKLAPENVRVATPLQQQLVNEALDRPVPGTKATARHLADWLRKRGHEVYLVGGIVRDLVSMTDPNGQQHTHDALSKAMNDVDLVTSAPPDTLRAAYKAVFSDLGPSGGVYTGDEMQAKGVVTNGKVDLASLAVKGVYDPAKWDAQAGATKAPSVFDHDLLADAGRRDVTANALYYDVHNHVVADPTGTGITDARAKLLREVDHPDWSKNETLALRYWKFRMRGWKGATDKIKATVKAQQAALLPANLPPSVAGKQFSGAGLPGDAALAKLKDAMSEDGMPAGYFAKLKPDNIAPYIKAHKG